MKFSLKYSKKYFKECKFTACRNASKSESHRCELCMMSMACQATSKLEPFSGPGLDISVILVIPGHTLQLAPPLPAMCQAKVCSAV